MLQFCYKIRKPSMIQPKTYLKNKQCGLGICMGMEPLRSSALIPLACLNYSLIFFLTWSKGDYDAKSRYIPTTAPHRRTLTHTESIVTFEMPLKKFFLILLGIYTIFWGILPRFVCTWVEQVIFQEVLDGKFWGLIQEPLQLNAGNVWC